MALYILADEGGPTAVSIDGDDLRLAANIEPLCELAGDITDLSRMPSEHALAAIFSFTLETRGIGARLALLGVRHGHPLRSGDAPCITPRWIEAEKLVALLGDQPRFLAKDVVPVAVELAQPSALRAPIRDALHASVVETYGATVHLGWDDSEQTLIARLETGAKGEASALELVFRFPRESVKEFFAVARIGNA